MKLMWPVHSIAPTLPLSIYIHFPWCIRKCPYCDFNSHAVKEKGIPQQTYFDALLTELALYAPTVAHRSVCSIFIGGGTPSLMEPKLLALLLERINQQFQVASDCEITLEANPGTFDKAHFHAFRQAGVNRLSLGVQSLNDKHLQAIGRIHDSQQAKKAIETVQTLFDTFNLDLMYALPGQSLSELNQDLEAMLAFEPPHLSIYHLTIEANTYFAKYPPKKMPDDDLASQMLDMITEKTAQNGLARYEVSAYAQAGKQCRHNRHYWEYGDYLGIGAGAHGKLSTGDEIVRTVNYRDPDSYMKHALEGKGRSSIESISLPERPFEFMLGALRLKEGVPTSYFSERTSLPLDCIEQQKQMAIKAGLLSDEESTLKATDKGFDFLSDLQEMFLPDR